MRVLSVKDGGVTQGVINENMDVKPHLKEVTFLDYTGVPHTVFAHQDGPWQDPKDIVEAWYNGELHDRPAETSDTGEGEPAQKGSGF